MRRIHVLLFSTSLDFGGTEGQLLELVTHLDPNRFEPTVACLRKSGALVPILERHGVRLLELPIRSLWGFSTWAQQLRFARHLRAAHVDVVHSTGFYTNVFALPVARAAGIPAIGSVREQAAHWSPVQRRANWLALRLADRIVVNAETTRRELCNHGLRRDALRLIRNGLDATRFLAARPARTLCGELFWPPDAPVVAVVSRIARGKGVDVFLDAAAQVSARRPDVRFLVVGDSGIVQNGVAIMGEERLALEQRARALGLGERMRFIGFRRDVPELLAQVQVAVAPSLSEALSNSLLEAMAAGAPVVATTVGDHALVVEDGESGLLVAPNDPEALAHAIERLLGDAAFAARLGAEARRRVRERFAVGRMVRETEAVYAELASATEATCSRST